jgi:urease accessory protein
VGSVLLAGPGLTGTPATGEGWAVLPLTGPGVLVTAVAPDSAALRRRMRAGENAAADADMSVSALRSGTS